MERTPLVLVKACVSNVLCVFNQLEANFPNAGVSMNLEPYVFDFTSNRNSETSLGYVVLKMLVIMS